jgi:hypothetical protein
MSRKKGRYLVAGVLVAAAGSISAGEVEIVAADFHEASNGRWNVSVTLKHDDTGWEHYADNWQVVDENGKLLGDRVLFHPHVNEQPFTRSLSSVQIPEDVSVVYITAHDKKHGWTDKRLTIDLEKVKMGRLKTVAE